MARVCFIVCRDIDLEQEAAQNAWPIVWRKLGTIREPDRLRPWLLAVATNEFRQVARRQSRQAVREIMSRASRTPAMQAWGAIRWPASGWKRDGQRCLISGTRRADASGQGASGSMTMDLSIASSSRRSLLQCVGHVPRGLPSGRGRSTHPSPVPSHGPSSLPADPSRPLSPSTVRRPFASRRRRVRRVQLPGTRLGHRHDGPPCVSAAADLT